MKKNILAIAILAAVIANIILSAVTLFAIVPAANNTNMLIKKICTVINLELENPDASSYTSVPLKNRKPYTIGSGLTINLKKADGETKNRYALIDFTVILNSAAADYADVTAVITDQSAILNEYLTSLVRGYTADEMNDETVINTIKGKMLSYCRTYFRSSDAEASDELVVDVTLAITIN